MAGEMALAIELPEDIAWVLGALGFQWIFLDEDKFHSAADSFRTLASDLSSSKSDADGAAQTIISGNKGDAIDAFGTAWDKLSNSHVKDLIDVCGVFADILGGIGDAITVAKVAILAQVVAAAAAFAAAAVGTIFTLGLSDALGAAAEIGFKELIQQAIDELERAVEQQALYLAKQEVLSVVEGVLSNIIGQGLGDALGVSSGFSASSALDAGWKSGVSNAEGLYKAYTNPKFLASDAGQMLLGAGVGTAKSAFGGEGDGEGAPSGDEGGGGE
jgi:hypothetical protein